MHWLRPKRMVWPRRDTECVWARAIFNYPIAKRHNKKYRLWNRSKQSEIRWLSRRFVRRRRWKHAQAFLVFALCFFPWNHFNKCKYWIRLHQTRRKRNGNATNKSKNALSEWNKTMNLLRITIAQWMSKTAYYFCELSKNTVYYFSIITDVAIL